jgi:hypothetical protein
MKRSHKETSSCFSFELLFENDPLTGISAHIVIRCASKDENGTTYVTPECATSEEVHYQFDRLKAELEILRVQAMREFVKAINGQKRKRTKKP